MQHDPEHSESPTQPGDGGDAPRGIPGVPFDAERQALRRSAAPVGDEDPIRGFVIEAAKLASDLHCEDVVVFDTRGVSEVTDYIVIGSGTSDRQMRSVADDIHQLAKKVGLGRFGHEADASATWIVMDFVDVVFHLFEPNTRAHYDLEMMWNDAERVAWDRPR